MKNYWIFYCLVFFSLWFHCDCFIKKLWKKLFKKKTIKISILSVENELEYPGGDPLLLQEIKDQWEKYYACLRQQKQAIKKQGSITPRAMMVFEGTSTRLICEACLAPNELDTPITWHHIPAHSTIMRPVEYGEHLLLSPNKTLAIYNAKVSDSGEYFCMSGAAVQSVYFLDITNDEPSKRVKPSTAPKPPHSTPSKRLPENNLKLFTTWTEWSSCSTCGVAGKRIRYGMCTIQILSTSVSNKYTDSDISLQVFKDGLPCRSFLLSQDIKDLHDVQERKSEIMIGYCKVPCSGQEVFELKDTRGNLLEVANNTAGIYSIAQGVPSVPPVVQRSNMYEYRETRIIIKCPGNLNTDHHIEWKLGEDDLNPVLIGKETEGRMYIDLRNYIYINYLQFADAGIYSCWQDNQLAGTVTLHVLKKKVRFTINHHLALLGVVLILFTIFILILRGFKLKTDLKEQAKQPPT